VVPPRAERRTVATPPRRSAARERAAALVAATEGDPLAPFLLRTDKAVFTVGAGRAALGYRVAFGTAVVAGDPVGDPQDFAGLLDAFLDHAHRARLRVAVLAASDATATLWAARGLRAVPIGRDVVIDVAGFSLHGRALRNLRQAVARTHNAGVSVAVHTEATMPAELAAALRALRAGSAKRRDRGFAMLLGNLLDGSHPDAVVAVAFDAAGTPVAFQRYLRAGRGGLTLDLPVRRATAPNGVDERLTVEVVAWAREQSMSWVSLAFAPFADLYGRTTPTPATRAAVALLHALDPLIAAGGLFHYVEKFHALGGRRLVLLRARDLLPAGAAMLLQEFR